LRETSEYFGPMDVSEITAMLHAGRHAELATKVRAELRRQPNAGMLWKALSVALTFEGADALHASQEAARLMPDDAEAHANLGNTLLRSGRFEDAAISYNRALAINPRYPEVCNHLGYALRRLGRPDESVLRYRQALDIRPHYPDAWNNLGNALLDLKQFGEAAASYRRALTFKPDLAEAHNNLGNALRGLGHMEEALECYRRALAMKPEFVGAHTNLGDTLRDLGKLLEAAASFSRAVELAPNFAEAHNSLGNVLLDLGNLEEAEASYRRVLALEPRSAVASVNLGSLLRQRGLAAAAEASCLAALQVKPDAAPAFVLLADLRADAGDFAAAEALLQRAAALDADSPEAWAGMAHLRKMTLGDAAWAEQAQRVAGRGLPARQETCLRFAIGKYFDDVENYPQAFANFRRAHELTRTHGAKYDRRRQTLAADRLIGSFDAAWARTTRARFPGSARAVFIVGMQRSGTTLAEQILASHPAVFGGGELPYWKDATLELRTGASHGGPRRDIVMRMGSEYVELLKKLSMDSQRVIDKMPGNFWSLGLIHEALPNARIIHMRRDPVDTCLSIYFQHFKNALPYADDLADLAHFYGEHQRIMRHWATVLPADAMLEVPYEGMVADQEMWSRKMLQFIGLEWDPRCLDFHQTSRSVVTASKWQVRQKMNRSSIQRWRNYEQFIGPLLTLLHPP
jgi:tetratricopeptide (TPR) repeat protein